MQPRLDVRSKKWVLRFPELAQAEKSFCEFSLKFPSDTLSEPKPYECIKKAIVLLDSLTEGEWEMLQNLEPMGSGNDTIMKFNEYTSKFKEQDIV